jgi:hypothetical protein
LQIQNMKKKTLMEKLMKTKEWFSSFDVMVKVAVSDFDKSNENTVINFPL